MNCLETVIHKLDANPKVQEMGSNFSFLHNSDSEARTYIILYTVLARTSSHWNLRL